MLLESARHVTITKREVDMADEKDLEKTIAEDLVVTKYKMAGEIVNRELYLIDFIQPNVIYVTWYLFV